jgi:hypothetical protein
MASTMDIDNNIMNELVNLKESLTNILQQIQDTPENKVTVDNIKKQLDTLETKLKQVDDFEFNTIYTKEKTLLVIGLYNFIKDICKVPPKIYGSFLRQILEKVFVSIYDNSGYANSQNHDIDISVFKDKIDFSYSTNNDRFNKLCRFFQRLKHSELTFNGFYIKDFNNSTLEIKNNQVNCNCGSIYCRFRHQTRTLINNSSLKKLFNIPHYHIIFTKKICNKDINIMIDLFSYSVTTEDTEYNIDADIDVNKLEISTEGIVTRYNEFTDVLYNIINKTGTCNINFNHMIDKLRNYPLVFENKKEIYNCIIIFLMMRLKFLNKGYTKLTSHFKICKYEIENKEPCEITGLEPPYINIILECGHKMSIMAFTGATNVKPSDSSEGINCPFCRHKLLPMLEDIKPSRISYPTKNDLNDLSINIDTTNKTHVNKQKIDRIESNKTMTSDNIDYVFSLLGVETEDNENNENNTNTEIIGVTNLGVINTELPVPPLIQLQAPVMLPIHQLNTNLNLPDQISVNGVPLINNILNMVENIMNNIQPLQQTQQNQIEDNDTNDNSDNSDNNDDDNSDNSDDNNGNDNNPNANINEQNEQNQNNILGNLYLSILQDVGMAMNPNDNFNELLEMQNILLQSYQNTNQQ